MGGRALAYPRRVRILAALLLAPLLTGCPASESCECAADAATVHAFTAWGPAEGATVIVHDADGTPRIEGLTADDGTAEVSVGGGELVSVWYLIDVPEFGIEEVSMRTIGGVQPGDDLFFEVTGVDPMLPDRGEVEFTLAGGPFAGADRYAVRAGGCGVAQESTSDPAGVVSVTVPAGCGGDDLVPWTAALQTGLAIAFQVGAPAPFDALAAGGVTFEGPWRTDFDEVSFSLDALPAGATAWGVGQALYDAFPGRLATGGSAGLVGVQTDIAASFPVIPFSSAAFASTTVEVDAGDAAIRRILTLDPGEDFAVDFDALPLFVTTAHVAATAAALTISWDGAPASAEQLQIEVRYFAGDARSVSWTLRLPADTPSPFVFPLWPDELADNGHPPVSAYVDPSYIRFVDGEWADAAAARTDDPRDDLPLLDRIIAERRVRPAP